MKRICGGRKMGYRSRLPHIAIFPFMSKGHTVPLIHLAHLLHQRGLAAVTFFTTPLNAPFLRCSLAGIDASVVELPFPEHLPPDLPAGVQSTDLLPSMSLFLPFVSTIKLLRPNFEQALTNLPVPADILISDGFLGWTVFSAAQFGIPRIVSYGMGSFSMTVSCVTSIFRPHVGVASYDDSFPVDGFAGLFLTKNDLNPPFDDPDPTGPLHEFVMEQNLLTKQSSGLLVNSFQELEKIFIDRWNRDFGPKAWAVGPLCLAWPSPAVPADQNERPAWMRWLDDKAAARRSVLYVAFGTQAEVAAPQLREIAAGLERSGVDFLWVVRADIGDDGFEERVAERGLVVKEWVDQLAILRYECVEGFLSHCGWNSVLEAVSAGVPVLAWPMMAEQPLNAKFVVEVSGVGLRMPPPAGDEGVVKGEEIAVMVRELIAGKKGREVRKAVKALAAAAATAMEDGGSSWGELEKMIEEGYRMKESRGLPGEETKLEQGLPPAEVL